MKMSKLKKIIYGIGISLFFSQGFFEFKFVAIGQTLKRKIILCLYQTDIRII